MVVIAIIAILAALLLPVLSKGKSAAQSAGCQSNLHQIGIGLISYVSDFHKYPLQGVNFDWHDILKPYTAANPTNASGLYICAAFGLASPYPVTSYGYNDSSIGAAPNFTVAPLAEPPSNATPESALAHPNDLYAIADARLVKFVGTGVGGTTITGSYGEAGFDYLALNGPVLQELPVDIHLSGRNIVFCDGHIESVKRVKLFEQTDTWTRRWFIDGLSHPSVWTLYPTN